MLTNENRNTEGQYTKLNKTVELITTMQDSNLAPIIACTGALGLGKTSLSIQLARRILIKRTGKDYFDPNKWIGYDNDEVYHKYLTLPEMSTLIGDEAARFAMGEDWNRYENKELKKNLMQLRPRRIAFFLNLPRFSWFDSKYKGELIRLWCWVVSRGVALVFEPDENQALTDPWHLDEMKKIRTRITPFTDLDTIHKLFNRHPCYVDMITYPEVPKDIYDKYMELRTQRTYTDKVGEFVPHKEMAKIMCYNLQNKWPEIYAAIQETKQKNVTAEILADYILKDPKNGKSIVTKNSVYNWVNEVNNTIAKWNKNNPVVEEIKQAEV